MQGGKKHLGCASRHLTVLAQLPPYRQRAGSVPYSEKVGAGPVTTLKHHLLPGSAYRMN